MVPGATVFSAGISIPFTVSGRGCLVLCRGHEMQTGRKGRQSRHGCRDQQALKRVIVARRPLLQLVHTMIGLLLLDELQAALHDIFGIQVTEEMIGAVQYFHTQIGGFYGQIGQFLFQFLDHLVFRAYEQ